MIFNIIHGVLAGVLIFSRSFEPLLQSMGKGFCIRNRTGSSGRQKPNRVNGALVPRSDDYRHPGRGRFEHRVKATPLETTRAESPPHVGDRRQGV